MNHQQKKSPIGTSKRFVEMFLSPIPSSRNSFSELRNASRFSPQPVSVCQGRFTGRGVFHLFSLLLGDTLELKKKLGIRQAGQSIIIIEVFFTKGEYFENGLLFSLEVT
ncbi:hypothetical protein TNCV_4514391 [Trichonephila clavipes]|nr:hypothetical protein TNCV_4514391 [Trichonephila clavipes]